MILAFVAFLWWTAIVAELAYRNGLRNAETQYVIQNKETA
jgi:hypothetical protein